MTRKLYASIKDVSNQYGFSRATAHRMIKDGRINAVKIGRLTRVCLASVEQYFASLPAIGSVTEAV
ncbi:helix-turn-helix domain-containing protein [Kozakia baliensis]|uniref:helix-turn-helix domain-containing protein n=1 Tax=Kozakia baliensis TaxID=153496 RepID=UPI00345C1B46